VERVAAEVCASAADFIDSIDDWSMLAQLMLFRQRASGGASRIHARESARTMNTSTKFRVLVVDDDAAMLDWLLIALHCDRFETQGARDGARAASLLESWEPDVVVTDLRLPQVDGLALLTQARQSGYPPEVLVLTGHGSVSHAVRAMQGGAHTFLEKPVEPEALLAMVDRALEHRSLRVENKRLRERLDPPPSITAIIGEDRSVKALLETVSRVAASDANCLILGENGTGKELVANAIHASSARAPGPFIKINCAAIPGELMESELFGHRKGAFTGAISDKVGLFELANGGSLLLDEIGEMPAYLQSKLLRVLQEREYRPVGTTRTVRVDVRLICATNVNVDAALESGRLRPDLYFRINTITLRIPPLRDRPNDIPLLVTHFIQKFRKRYEREVARASREALEVMRRYRWPGNVRELENVVERAIVLTKGPEICVQDLPDTLHEVAPETDPTPLPALTLAEIERMALVQTLRRTNWNKQEAAHILGLYRPTLYSKMRRHAIEDGRKPRINRDSAAK
jgi:DNA-binding NtrC family response regulator